MTTINVYSNVSYHVRDVDIVITSLEAILQRATSPSNTEVDYPAIEAFCALVNKEKHGPSIASRLIATKIHSTNENETLQTLHLLDFCMRKCGPIFHAEIGKFRFLNEMIKLVSLKYLGKVTPATVKQRIIQLMYCWTLDYPKEVKVKEAYDMLKRQGVVKYAPNVPAAVSPIVPPQKKKGTSMLHDEENNKLLQRLLRSKNREDLQAANRLIKNMVRENDNQMDVKVTIRKISVLEHAHNNVKLLNEMLDSYILGISSHDELDLINELHQSCERLRPEILKLASECKECEETLNEILDVNDELSQIYLKYTTVIIRGKFKAKLTDAESFALLDLCGGLKQKPFADTKEPKTNNLDLLTEVFSDSSQTKTAILQPVTTSPSELIEQQEQGKKQKALDELGALSEQLLENLSSKKTTTFSKTLGKVPMNMLLKPTDEQPESSTASGLNLDCLMNKKETVEATTSLDDSADDVLVDISEEVDNMKLTEGTNCDKIECHDDDTKDELNFSDIVVELEDVQPSGLDPLAILNEKNGVNVSIHFTENKPRWDVNIVVITTINKNKMALTNFQFQAVVPKNCKLKLQKASGTGLPPYNPFIPPLVITQILLISNPMKEKVSLNYMVSYTIQDETITEMGEVSSLPLVT